MLRPCTSWINNYAAAVQAKPGKRITLRQRARVLDRRFP